jgi:hypothetical protein
MKWTKLIIVTNENKGQEKEMITKPLTLNLISNKMKGVNKKTDKDII